MAKAKEVGIADEVDKYMKMHLDSMLKGDPKLGFGRTDIKESYQENDCKDYESKEYEMTKYLETKKNSLEDVVLRMKEKLSVDKRNSTKIKMVTLMVKTLRY